MFSLMWSEHCGYKHSHKLLQALPTEGPKLILGPGRERRRGRRRRRPGVRVQGRVAQPPERGRAVPGRRDRRRRDPARRVRDRRAADRGARLAALRRARRLRALALPARARGRRHRPLRQLDRRATVGGEIYFEGPYEQNCLVNAMCVGLIETDKLIRSRRRRRRQRARAVRRAHRPRRDRRRVGARERRARRRRRRQAPDGADRRPVRGEEAARVLARAARRRAARRAAGPRRRRPDVLVSAEMAAKGEVGLDLDVARVPLREADMEPFEIMVSESQERMLCVVEPDARRRGARGLRQVGGQRDRDRRGHRLAAACGCSTAATWSATCRSRALVDECPLYDLEPARAGACRSTRRRAHARRRARRRRARCSRCWAPPTSPRAGRSFEQYDCIVARARCAGPRQADAAVLDARRTAARSPSRSTATAAASRSTPTAARSRPCSSARPTSPASAPSRSA